MANYSSSGYTTKYPDEYYYEKLNPKVRKALQECVQPWSSRWCYKMMETHGADSIIKMLKDADRDFMKKGFRMEHFKKNHPSSFTAVKVNPLKANW